MSSTLDRYLFAIRILKDQYVCVRAVDVAHYLRISKPSVSTSIRQMREQGLIEVEQDGNLLLSDEGRIRAERLLSRVSFFRELLTQAGMDREQALRDAISFSWEMSDASYRAFQRIGEEWTGSIHQSN